MGLDRRLIQAAFLCGGLAMPAFAGGAEISDEDALLGRISTEIIPRIQLEYVQAAIGQFTAAMDIATFRARLILDEGLQQWYVEGIYDGVPTRVTADLLERWALSPSMPYYLEAIDIPDCAHGSVLLPNCR